MKKLILIFYLSVIGQGTFAGGLVMFSNPFNTSITTNGPGGSGLTSIASNQFFYGLFVAPMGTTETDLLHPVWTFTGNYATNMLVPGRFRGNTAEVDGWEVGTTMSFIVAGWSASLGHDWSTIENQISSGIWVGPGFFGQ